MKNLVLRTILFGLTPMLNRAAKKSPAFKEEASRYNCVLQIRVKNNSVGRYFRFQDGKITSKSGVSDAPDIQLVFKNVDVALKILNPNAEDLYKIHAAKNFLMEVVGPDPLGNWILKLMQRMTYEGFNYGEAMPDGCMRYTTITNGGPLHVHVRDSKIVRMTPIEFSEEDAPSWTIKAKGREFSPQRKTTVAPHGSSMKSTVYAENRLLYPMKRVDFDPNGERNPQNRGISGYERISWDEALDIVAGEINRQKRVHGPGAIFLQHCSHHQWGNVGYYLSAMMRFGNLIGFTRMAMNPDSWEGWFWGALHHCGFSHRVGIPPSYGTLEDCLQEAEQIVFWSSDPESTNASYAAFESTPRRLWAKELGFDFVHIDPHYNPTAQLLGGKWMPIKPGTDSALALAIMYVWVEEGLYDKEYVADRTTDFDEWKAYLLGETDGQAKTPDWQEGETGVPARDVRALARTWAKKKTYLSCGMSGTGFGGACRGATGQQWARNMVMMMAMQGWGKPGRNMGGLINGSPVDHQFYFPGYADGGISGDLNFTGDAINNYQRMPHVLTTNPVNQQIPKQRIPEAIINGHAEGYLWDGFSQEAQFTPISYPAPGFSPIHMIYRYGSSAFSTTTNSSRFAESYRHDSIEFVVNQSVFMEGETQFADVILPACTNLERWDIGEWCSAGGYGMHNFEVLNHRVIAIQHKCIEPLGESKSDYQIFNDILERLGLGAVFTEGCSELDWARRIFDSSDVAQHVSWKEFLKKGYFVVPSELEEELRPPLSMSWFAEDRRKDLPEPFPLPSQYAEEFGYGLQTPSGKFEFIPTVLKRNEAKHPDRPALNRYFPSWEGPKTAELTSKFPLQMIATHSRYSFHTFSDGATATNQIADHRRLIDGHYYWLARISEEDAAARGIEQNDLVKVYNDRGAVICAADISSLVSPGVIKSYEASARYQMMEVEGESLEVGGSLNILTPDRPQTKGTHSMSPNSTLVEVEKYAHAEALFEKLRAA
ncbi:MAG: molybdopterin-dependent oxidoreductase [Pseudomonadota bacterium]